MCLSCPKGPKVGGFLSGNVVSVRLRSVGV